MTVYSTATLRNLYIHRQLDEARNERYLTRETIERIKNAHPVDLYTPNLFVKIGLAFLTAFICLCSVGLIALLSNVSGSPAIFLLFTGAVCYAVLEVMTGQKKHYNSGVDNILMLASVILIVTGLMFNYNGNRFEIVLSILIFIGCVWLTIRFTDSLAAIAGTIALLSFAFFAYTSLGTFAISTFPFLLITISAVLYYFSRKYHSNNQNVIYQDVWKAVSVIALAGFYFWGNYYVAQTLSTDILHSTLPLPWLFWAWTYALPLLYFIRGIKDKELLLIRVGTLLVAVCVLTWQYYYSILSAEAAMLIAGVILVTGAYLLVRYLRTGKHGFVFDNNTVGDNKFKNLEGFVIGQIQGADNTEVPEPQFGGGSFGGAGAGAKF